LKTVSNDQSFNACRVAIPHASYLLVLLVTQTTSMFSQLRKHDKHRSVEDATYRQPQWCQMGSRGYMGGNFQVSRIPETSKMRVLPHFVIGLTFADNFDPAYFTFSQLRKRDNHRYRGRPSVLRVSVSY
jgi:hypothetical protein